MTSPIQVQAPHDLNVMANIALGVEWDEALLEEDSWHFKLHAYVSLPLVSFPTYPTSFVLKVCNPWISPGPWNGSLELGDRHVDDSTVVYSSGIWTSFETDENTRHFPEDVRRKWTGKNRMLFSPVRSKNTHV